MKAALLLALAAVLFPAPHAHALTAGKADCPALVASRNPDAVRVAASASRPAADTRETEASGAQPGRTPGALLRSLLQLGQKKSDGLIVSDSAHCRVALNATYGKVTPVAAKGWTTVLVVTW